MFSKYAENVENILHFSETFWSFMTEVSGLKTFFINSVRNVMKTYTNRWVLARTIEYVLLTKMCVKRLISSSETC